MLDLKLIQETKDLISPYIYETPLDYSRTLKHKETKFYFKNEGLQHTRSFKMRGAFSKLLRLSDQEKESGVIAISSGNHGIAVSYAAKKLKIDKVKIFVPKNTPPSKTKQIVSYGSDLVINGASYDDAYALGMSYVKDHKMTYVDGWDRDELIYAGQGTIGLEILKQNPNIDTILVPIGGGGLITGIAVAAKAIKPDIRIIGVQTEACPAMKASLDDKNHYHDYPSKPSVCEALIGGVGHLSYGLANKCIDDILIVKESSIKAALKHMLLEERMIIEASSCVVVAALNDHPDYDFGSETALVLSGNNIDIKLMKEMIK